MTDELKKIIFSPQISKVFCEHNWVINTDSKSKFHSYFVGDIADYYLDVQQDDGRICLQFALDIEIPKNKLNELLRLINIIGQETLLKTNTIQLYIYDEGTAEKKIIME